MNVLKNSKIINLVLEETSLSKELSSPHENDVIKLKTSNKNCINDDSPENCQGNITGGVSENVWCGNDLTKNELLEYVLEVENSLMGGENFDASVETKGGKELSMTTAEILDVEPATAEEAEWKAVITFIYKDNGSRRRPRCFVGL
ncbi:hypothetical protein RN001_012743 [Aquatica leii]|uniref:Uncharacterized protein n=1 Tax=Aquatica leii TaxID=1421715 RepID=A0AAN7P7V8_9COLE|nr:hypothetical protein RN001_012743 [Aquatica leii]